MTLFTIFVCCLAFLTLIGGQKVANVSKIFYDLEDHQRLFKDFLKDYNKYYVGEELDRRLIIFKECLQEINELNKVSKYAVYAINFFCDLTNEELESYMGLKYSDSAAACDTMLYTKTFDIPDTLDYREKNMVTPVKMQGNCGSCYAFSAIGTIEGQYAKKYNKLVSFSEEQIVDCDKYTNGCGGGAVTNVFSYISSQGIELQSDYPYTGVQGKCKHDPSKSKAKVASCSILKFNSEEDIKYALNEYGPLSIGLFASSLAKYHGGIHHSCPDAEVNHGLVLVGYGSENNVPYWLIKNSWGGNWGEAGYLRLQRGKNLCDMGTMVNVALIE